MTLDEAINHVREVAERIQKDANKQKGLNHGYYVWQSVNADKYRQIAQWLEELKEYKQLEEQGLLLKLPCKVGDIIYEVDEAILLDDVIEPIKCKVTYILLKTEIHIDVEVIEGHGIGSTYTFKVEDFGKTVFLTKEEAEEKLKELNISERN